MTCLLLRWYWGMIRSKLCKNAIPRATSTARRRAAAVSTTTPVPSWSSVYKDPHGMCWFMTTKFGGELQQPITGKTFGWEKILKEWKSYIGGLKKAQFDNGWIYLCNRYLSLGNSSLKSLETRALQSRTERIFATMSFFCQRPLHVSPDGDEAIWIWRCRSLIFMPLWRERVASPKTISIIKCV